MQKANLNLVTGTFQFPFNLPGESWCESYAECVFVSVCVIFSPLTLFKCRSQMPHNETFVES